MATGDYKDYVDEDLSLIQENAKRQLQNDYDELIRQKVNALNKRGAFGSSIASEDVGDVNYALGQSLSDLAARSAEQRINRLLDNEAQSLAEKQLAMQQAQFEANLEEKRAAREQQAKQQLAQQQLRKFEDELAVAQAKQALNPNTISDYVGQVLFKYRNLLGGI